MGFWHKSISHQSLSRPKDNTSTFSLQIYHGREYFRELYEFTEDLFGLVSPHLFAEDSNDALRAAALYLLYGLYFKQATIPKVRRKENIMMSTLSIALFLFLRYVCA